MTGKAGSGKSTIAAALVQSLKDDGVAAEVLSFATPLKLMLQALFDYAEPDDHRAAWRWAETKERPSPVLGGRTPRHAMQTLGAEWGRDLVHPDLWLSLAKERVRQVEQAGTTCVVFDDARFPNEVEWIMASSGAVVRVSRPHESTVLTGKAAAHASEATSAACTIKINNTMRPPREIARAIRMSLSL